jgi:hypothetical protein
VSVVQVIQEGLIGVLNLIALRVRAPTSAVTTAHVMCELSSSPPSFSFSSVINTNPSNCFKMVAGLTYWYACESFKPPGCTRAPCHLSNLSCTFADLNITWSGRTGVQMREQIVLRSEICSLTSKPPIPHRIWGPVPQV